MERDSAFYDRKCKVERSTDTGRGEWFGPLMQFIHHAIVALLRISIHCSLWSLRVLSVPVSYLNVFFFMCLATTDSVMATALERNVFGVFLKPGVNLPSVFASVRRLGTPPFGDRQTPRWYSWSRPDGAQGTRLQNTWRLICGDNFSGMLTFLFISFFFAFSASWQPMYGSLDGTVE